MSNLQYSGLPQGMQSGLAMRAQQGGLRTGLGGTGTGGGGGGGGPSAAAVTAALVGAGGAAGGYPSYNQLLNRQGAAGSGALGGGAGVFGAADYAPLSANGQGPYQQRAGGPQASAAAVASLQKLQQQQQQAAAAAQQQAAARGFLGAAAPNVRLGSNAAGRFSQLDSFESDFPALPGNVPAGHGSYGASDFQLHNDDFPALPGPQGFKDDLGFLVSGGYYPGDAASKLDAMSKLRISDAQQPQPPKPKSAIGAPIGSSAVGGPVGSGALLGGGGAGPDRYGLMGMLNVIRMSEPDLTTLAIGTDLTLLGLNLNSPDPLYSIFVSPWADGSSRREPDYRLPQCYHLATPQNPIPKIASFSDDTLFYVFYSMPRDQMQELAAQQLYMRNWRFHKERKIWLTRDPSTELIEKTDLYERGLYIYFDVKSWERVRMELTLRYDALEERVIPQSGASSSPASGSSAAGTPTAALAGGGVGGAPSGNKLSGSVNGSSPYSLSSVPPSASTSQ